MSEALPSDVKLGQQWVDKIMSQEVDDSPSVDGAGSRLTKEQWLARYKQRFVEAGLTDSEATNCMNAVELSDDLSDYPSLADDPERAAEDEMSYWDDDGDGNE